jgi:hypothetical protein
VLALWLILLCACLVFYKQLFPFSSSLFSSSFSSLPLLSRISRVMAMFTPINAPGPGSLASGSLGGGRDPNNPYNLQPPFNGHYLDRADGRCSPVVSLMYRANMILEPEWLLNTKRKYAPGTGGVWQHKDAILLEGEHACDACQKAQTPKPCLRLADVYGEKVSIRCVYCAHNNESCTGVDPE